MTPENTVLLEFPSPEVSTGQDTPGSRKQEADICLKSVQGAAFVWLVNVSSTVGPPLALSPRGGEYSVIPTFLNIQCEPKTTVTSVRG